MLTGLIVRTTVARGKIRNITLPTLDNRFTVVGTRDIGGTNRVKAIVNATPLFTSSTVSYKGQIGRASCRERV